MPKFIRVHDQQSGAVDLNVQYIQSIDVVGQPMGKPDGSKITLFAGRVVNTEESADHIKRLIAEAFNV